MAFKVENNGLSLEINDKVFVIYPDEPGFDEKITSSATRIKDIANVMNTIAEGVETCTELVEDILGDGAVNDIFPSGHVGLFALCDVLNFVYEEYNKYMKTGTNRMMKNARAITSKEHESIN